MHMNLYVMQDSRETVSEIQPNINHEANLVPLDSLVQNAKSQVASCRSSVSYRKFTFSCQGSTPPPPSE